MDHGFLGSPLATPLSLLRVEDQRQGRATKKRNFRFLSSQGNSPRPGRRIRDQVKMPNPNPTGKEAKLSKRGTLGRKIRSKGSPKGTILRAVPDFNPTLCSPAPLSPMERDMATLPNQEILANIGWISPPSSQAQDGYAPSRSQYRKAPSPATPSSSKTLPVPMIPPATEMQYPELQGTIGIYKHGLIQWEHRKPKSSKKPRRPRIQVIIPNDVKHSPLPTSPFFGQVTIGLATDIGPPLPAGFVFSPTVAGVPPPPEASRRLTSDPVVTPPAAQRLPNPVTVSQSELLSANAQAVRKDNTVLQSQSHSSDESHQYDSSSAYSNRTSISSVEPSCPSKEEPERSHARKISEFSTAESPVNLYGGALPSKKAQRELPSLIVDFASTHRRPRPHHHIPIEHDSEFLPTCRLHPPRTIEPTVMRQGLARPKSATRRPQRRSITADKSTLGVLNQAYRRSFSAQLLRNTRTPTLTEAELDLKAHLSVISHDNPFEWDDVLPANMMLFDERTAPPALPRKSSKRLTLASPDLEQFSVARGDQDNDMSCVQPDNNTSREKEDHDVPCEEQDINITSAEPKNEGSTTEQDEENIDADKDSDIPQTSRTSSLGRGEVLKLEIPTAKAIKRLTLDDFNLSPLPQFTSHEVTRSITPTVAEKVILNILRSLDALDDLFAAAQINQGFYRVFKRHELELMRSTVRKMSPPAWEHREICYPGHDEELDEDSPELELMLKAREYTPTTYLQLYRRDKAIVTKLKLLIKERCESFLRPEMTVALISTDLVESARADDALWRIWTFCKLFGCGRGREEDIVAQKDWLKGGPLVHQQSCTFSILTTDSIEISDALASAPECFAKGNEDGLTAEQLFDMMELWNCLGVLLQPLGGRTIQAREHGVYESTDVRGGDIDGEEVMLDEWYYYLLTLGLSPILDLAIPSRKSDASIFIIAAENGWIENWTPPSFGGTRGNLLKEAASRVYEEKITVVYAGDSNKQVQKQLSKQRIQNHITELRRRRHSPTERPPATVRMSQERPMSEWDHVINNLTRPRPPPSPNANIASYIPALTSSTPIPAKPQQLTITIPNGPPPRASPPAFSPLPRLVARPLLSTPSPSSIPSVSVSGGDRRSSIVPSSAPSMPNIDEHFPTRPQFRSIAIEKLGLPPPPPLKDHPALRQHRPNQPSQGSIRSYASSITPSIHPPEHNRAFQQHQLQREIIQSDASENSADKAIFRIVEMGFTPEQARRALRMTDMGGGLRVDRAVELLLRESV